jgi:hypothetical protein
MPILALENEKTRRQYRLVSYDEPAGMVTLQDIKGEQPEFTLKAEWDKFKALGYKKVKLPDAPVDAPVDGADEDE